jgi:hypothetical protein
MMKTERKLTVFCNCPKCPADHPPDFTDLIFPPEYAFYKKTTKLAAPWSFAGFLTL